MVKIKVVQGESETATLNHQLGEYMYTGVPKAPAGQESVRVKFKISVDGLLTVTTTVVSLGDAHEEKIHPHNMNLKEAEVTEMI